MAGTQIAGTQVSWDANAGTQMAGRMWQDANVPHRARSSSRSRLEYKECQRDIMSFIDFI